MLVGVERFGLKVKDLAVVIGRGAGSASRLYAEAAAVRRSESGFATTGERVTEALRKSGADSSRRQRTEWDSWYLTLLVSIRESRRDPEPPLPTSSAALQWAGVRKGIPFQWYLQFVGCTPGATTCRA